MLTLDHGIWGKIICDYQNHVKNYLVTSSTFLEITIAQEYLLIIICMIQTDKIT